MIRTFIFLDLETTGLITQNCMPHITEMSLIAVSRSAICNSTDILPRVLQKLVLPIHPNVHISKKIHALTGLSNENLEGIQYFNSEIYNLVINFINRQMTPSCFVAYNGNNFDYPIFLSEFQNINKVFSEDILSIDMLYLIKDFFLHKQDPIEDVNTTESSISSLSSTEVSILLNDGYDEILSDALDSIMNKNLDDSNKNSLSSRNNEKATSHSDNVLHTPQSNSYKMMEINEKTPEDKIIKLQHCDKNFQKKKRNIVRRKLDFTNSQPTNFKLTSVCRHIFGTVSENAHTAEGDCLTMIRCATQLGKFFVEWADNEAVPLINHIRK
ncbi:Three prime repair exonuclease 2 [Eufriesea mexicana]|uniref:Three prime repair exonuclease 2 n=1 Tax=Eufriesea mexicana TaxID=516756 RepID=A0A310S5H1_9HYME|nr:PREDICTED: uncharacterized protein LOC108553377 [Eufriesea mexicana]OAD52727.1 Three prime repair exonuclease 2 [Eufriesea mexicana]